MEEGRWNESAFHLHITSWYCSIRVPGLSLLQKIKEAIPQQTEHTYHLEQLENMIPESVREEWTKEIEAWEDDSSNLNLLEPRVKGELSFNENWTFYSPCYRAYSE